MNFTKLKNCMDEIVQKYSTPGVDCIVYKEHEMVFRYFTGMSDIENKKKMNGNELYLIFSMTKMITCTAALQLFEQGKYLMEDPLSKYLPEFEKMKLSAQAVNSGDSTKIMTGKYFDTRDSKIDRDEYAKNPILIRDLFTMGSGLDYVLREDAIKNALAEGKKSTREIVGAMSLKKLWFEPGTRFRYGLSHDVIGALVEIWSGEKFGEYMKNHIFDLLNMEDTFFRITNNENKLNRMAALYNYAENGRPKRLPLESGFNLSEEYESGGAGLISSTEDYAVFLDALACGGTGKNGKKILSPETVELMGRNHLTGKQCDDFYQLRPGYGYGLGVRTHVDNTLSGSLSPIGEFGWDGAAGGFSLVDTKNKISLTYFQHIHNWDIKIQTELRNALYSCI